MEFKIKCHLDFSWIRKYKIGNWNGGQKSHWKKLHLPDLIRFIAVSENAFFSHTNLSPGHRL